MGMNRKIEEWVEGRAVARLHPRQQKMLYLQSVYDGDNYDHLHPWKPDHITVAGVTKDLPCSKREPAIQPGLIATKCDDLVESLIGEKQFCQLTFTGKDLSQETIKELDDFITKQLKIAQELETPVLDLVVMGAGALGLRIRGDGNDKKLQAETVEPAYCWPVFASTADGAYAEIIASELEEAGQTLETPAPDDYLAIPEGADNWDLIALRHEYESVRLVAKKDKDEKPTGEVEERTFLSRIDYLPGRTYIWEDIDITNLADSLRPEMEVADVEDGIEGLIPFAWCRGPFAKTWASEGKSLISSQLLSLGNAHDITATLKNDSVKLGAWPILAAIDGKFKGVEEKVHGQEYIEPDRPVNVDTGPSAVVQLESDNDDHQAQLKLLEMTGEGARAATEECKSLERSADNRTGLVTFDQTENAGAMAGVAIRRMMSPRTLKVSRYRRRLEDFVRALVEIAIRLVYGDIEYTLTVTWPEVVPLAPDEIEQLARAMQLASGGGAITSREIAVDRFTAAMGVEGAEDVLGTIRKEEADALNRAVDTFQRNNPDTDPDANNGG